MGKLNFQIKLAYSVELFGTGFYRGLSNQYREKYPELSKKLDDYAAHEYEHSKLFNRCYSDLFGKQLGGEGFWLGFGRCQSYFLFALPLHLKLRIASLTEILAIKQLERDIATGERNTYIEIAKKILPDEKKHADLYKEWKKS